MAACLIWLSCVCPLGASGKETLWSGGMTFEHYDRGYRSKAFTPDFDTTINAEEVITGGIGYKDFGNLLLEIEVCPLGHTLYPGWKPAVDFLTRGYSHCCDWCIVPRKEGGIHPASIWEEINRPGSREMIQLNNNVLALAQDGADRPHGL